MNAFTGEVHPVADLFPMLADDELAELAEDIKVRGLLQPIVLDVEGRLLDGRNRLAACDLAGVTPSFTTFDGADPSGYALAVNGQRRAQTKAQKAIVAANFSKLEKFGDQRKAARALGISDSRVSEAKVIVEHKDLALLVLAASKPFSTALDEARERNQRLAEAEAAKARLRDGAPDLMSLVDDERMSLDDAIAALEAREEKARQEAEDEAAAQSKEQQQLAAAKQEALNAWSQCCDALINTLSYAKTYTPPADIPHNYRSVNAFRELVDDLSAITQGWKEDQ